MQNRTRVFYGLAVIVPIVLGFLIWDIKGDIYELTGNIRLAQYVDREGKVIFPQDVLFVERHIENKYVDKKIEGHSSMVIFGQRNPDLPNYSLFLKIMGENPDDLNALFTKIEKEFADQSSQLIENVKASRKDQLASISDSIATIEKFNSAGPGTLRDGESFMNIYNQLNELKNTREFLEITLNPNNIFNFYRLDTPDVKKKRDKSLFLVTVVLGVLFLIVFLLYLIWRIEELFSKK